MTKEEIKLKRADKFMDKFKAEFLAKFGEIPNVTHTIGVIPGVFRITLPKLEKAVDNVLLRDSEACARGVKSVRNKARFRPFIFYRQVMLKLASDMGYGPSELERFFLVDHATVIHSRRIIRNKVYRVAVPIEKAIIEEINLLYLNDGTV